MKVEIISLMFKLVPYSLQLEKAVKSKLRYFSLGMLMILISQFTSGASLLEIYYADNNGLLSNSLFTTLIVIVFSIIVVATVVVYSQVRFKKLNRIIAEKEDRISRSESETNRLNKLLKDEKERMERDLAESERLYGIMLSSAEDGIAFYNMDWSIRFANSAFFSLIGFTEDEYRELEHEKRDLTLLHPDDIGYSEKRIAAIEESGYYEDEIRVKHKENGTYIVLSSKSVLIKGEEGNPLGVLLISRDITSFRNAQNELIVAKEKAEESNRLKTSFLANISHEIRTPLNSIVGFANLLNDNSTSDLVREEYIGYINQNTERLLLIISDIIDLSRLENSEIEIHYNPLRVNSVLDYIEAYTRSLISKSGKEIEFRIQKGLVNGRDIIYADEMWLKRVFRHLADNAVKFTRSGSIDITSAMAGTSMMFTVKDTGIGIGTDYINSIFEQFRQEQDGHHRPFEGLGVGLTLAKHVIEQMDGYLWVESEKGKGSEFFFTLPYRPVDGLASQEIKKTLPEEPEATSWNNRKILVVDDNSDVLRYLSRILSDTGVNVMLAKSGEEAVKIVHDTRDIDLILLDLQMEEMNGIEAAQEIKKMRGDLPIIAQTAYIFEEEQEKIIEAGCDACLIKPIRKEHLLSVISTFFGER